MPEIWEEKVATLSPPKPLHKAEDKASKKNPLGRKRFQPAGDAQDAVVILDAGGAIQDLTPAARRLLGYHPEQPFKPSFFSHVHTKDLYRVMRDVAEMAFHGRRQADWKLRLRTGVGRWHWFSATVGNQLDDPERGIRIYLTDSQA